VGIALSRQTLVILQSNYIPWKGYFDLIAAADEFLIYDEAQFTKNDWRNRNRIVLNGKPHWLTIAVKTAGVFGKSIEEVEVSDVRWAISHWSTIQQAYRHSPHWREIAPTIEAAYREASELNHLTKINELFLRSICGLLGLSTPILRADIVPRTTEDPTQRLVDICKVRRATTYLSGPAACDYLRPELFDEVGVALHYADYSSYPTYSQAMEPFNHGVSILDMLFQCGAAGASAQLKSISSPGSLTSAQE
jgi:WbqC-like protein family